jgi:hypothetical protein
MKLPTVSKVTNLFSLFNLGLILTNIKGEQDDSQAQLKEEKLIQLSAIFQRKSEPPICCYSLTTALTKLGLLTVNNNSVNI